jgi:hypothetical protein
MKTRIVLLLISLGLYSSSYAILSTPTQLAPANGATNQDANAILDWSAVTGSTGYNYQYDTSPAFNSPNFFNGTLGATSQVTLANLQFNTTYYWRVRAIKTTVPIDSSLWTAAFTFTTINNITNLSPANGATNQNANTILDWTAFSGISGYLYQYDTSPTFNSANLFNGSTGATSQVTLANLQFNTTYYWRVRAFHATDTSAYGPTWSFTTINAITNLTPANGATNQDANTILDWTAFSGISGYLYQYDTSPTFNSANLFNGSIGATSQVTLANLQFNTTYYWRVRAYHADDTSAYGPVWSFTTINSIINLSPANGAINQDVNAILDWTAFSGISGYLYQYDTSPIFNSANLFNGSIGATSQVTLANLQFNTTYYWRVRAFHVTDTSAYGPVWSFTTINAITNLTPANGAINQDVNTILDWTAFSGISGYLYQYDTSPTFNSANLFNGTTGATSQVTLANLQFNTTYYWRVRAFHATDTSAYGPVWSFTTINLITHLAPANGSIGTTLTPILDWTAFSGILGYQYRYSEDSTFATSNVGVLGATSQVTLPTLLYGTQYFWSVRAFHAADTSDWSNKWNFTTNYQMTIAPLLIAPANAATNIPLNGVQLEIGSVVNATDYQYQISGNSNFSNASLYSSPTLTLALGTLNPSITYYWRARGRNAAGNSPWASPFTFTTVAGAPPAPTNVGPLDAAINVDWLGTTFNWSQVAGATGYVLVFDDNAGFSSPITINTTDNFYTSGILDPNTTYYWQVQSENGNGSSSFSTVWSFTTGPVPAPSLSLPLNGATGIAINGTLLTWSAVNSATSYYVEYATNAAFTGAMGTSVTLTSYALPALMNNQTYYWHIYANYNSFSSVYSNTFSFTTASLAVLQPPVLVSPSNLATAVPITGTSLTWLAASGALSYDWEISTDAAFTTVVNGNTSNLTTLLAALNNNTTYYWHVRSVDASTVSAWSAAFSFTTAQAIPGVPNNISPADASINIDWLGTTITWSQEVYATGYVLLLDDDINFGSPSTFTTSDNFYVTGMLLPNTTYYWQVQATNGSGSSSFSTAWSFTTGNIPAPVLNNPINNATGLAISGLLLEWLPVMGATDYYIEYADNAAFTGASGNTVSSTSYLLPTLNNNQTYYWHVYAGYNAYSSNYSSSFMFTTIGSNILAAPQLISPSNLATAVPIVGTSLTWQSVLDALSYDWEISTDALFTTVVNGNTSNTNTLLIGLTDNTTYYWHVRSVNADTISDWSNTFSFTTDLLSGINDLLNNKLNCFIGNQQIIIVCDVEAVGNQFQVYNGAGQLVYEDRILGLWSNYNLAHLKSGLYFVRIHNPKVSRTFKVMLAD